MSSLARTRVGVIGAGAWAVQSHIPQLAARRDVELVAVCRHGASELERIRAEFGFGHASEDYRDLVALELDAIVVASPASLHFEHAQAALASGAHVLVEKPFTVTSADAWGLVELANQRALHIVVAFGYNWHPIVMEARRLLAERSIGELRATFVQMASGVGELLAKGTYPKHVEIPGLPAEPRTWSDPALSGGGYAPGQLSHALGVLFALVDMPVTDVFAFTTNEGTQVDVADAISIRYANGAVGSIGGSACPQGWGRDQLEIRLYGTEGQLLIDFDRAMVSRFHGLGEETRGQFDVGDGTYECVGPADTLVNLARGLEAENLAPGSLGARTVGPVEAGLLSSSTGAPARIRW